ncbi:MAG: hypothetical protein KIT02_15095 [Devosia sp.]|uniref:hypothetical protein n=1 Tax=Devosia sp. TaxID=1871048 RepID=UPI0024CB50B8|nr:hypothetical protein [Devosia sp.]UYN99228.1 MAG: hypothetical protein KIT02_15095 [Devosia sp.]
MRRLVSLFALGLVTTSPALGIDEQSQAVIDRLKTGKMVHIADVGVLMMGAEKWCYAEDDGNCSWSDIYLEVTADGARYEISNAWNENINIASTDQGEFRNDRYICETDYDWVATVHATSRTDGSVISGRALDGLRQEIRAGITNGRDDCFDYIFRGSDAAAETVTLLQRQYAGGEYLPANDVEVTLHFNAEDAAALGWYW